MATVAEILLARGEQQANQRRRQGEISAQMWRGLGDVAQQFGQNYQRQQEQAPRIAMEKMALQDAQQHQAGQAVIDRAMQPYQPVGPQPEGEAPAPAQHPYLDDQGLADPQKISALLSANGMAHLAPDLLKGVEQQNDAILKHQELQQKFSQQQAITLGTAANTTLKLMDAGLPFDQAVQHASSSLVATGLMKPEQLQGIVQQWGQLPDDQLRAQLQQVKATAARIGPTKKLGPNDKEFDMFGDAIASNPIDTKPHPVEKASFGLKMPDGTTQNVQGTFDSNANAGKGGYFYNGQDVTSRTVKDEPVSPTAQAKSYRVFHVGDVPLEFVPGRTASEPGSFFLNQSDGTRKQLYPGKDFVDVPTASQEPKPKVDITPEIQTSVIGGMRYVDASRYGKDELARARASAEQSGVPIVSKEVAEGVSAADRAAISLDTMWTQLKPYLPKDASGRLLSGPANTIDKVFQTNPVLGAFGSWRTAAIQAIQALAEKGMGLRLNQVEVNQMLESLPVTTDSAAAAEQKLRNIGTQIQNKVKVALTADRSTLAVSGGIIAPNASTPAPTTNGWKINNPK